MKTNQNKKFILILYLGIILSVPLFSIVYFNFNYLNNEIKKEKSFDRNLKTAGYWDLTGSPIFIDDADPNFNWSKTAADNDWCSGSGTWKEPYIIENVTIDGQYSVSCITIQNSSVYFIIRNCTLHRAGWNYDAGIKLVNVNNSFLINNTFTNDDFAGILLWKDCINNTIEDNLWYFEQSFCLMLYKFCHNNRILNNTMKHSGGNNIYFYENNNDNIIHGNYITGAGDALGAGSSIYFNNECDNNIISNNNLSDNYFEAIIFNTYCDHNIIKNNGIINNEYSFAVLLIQYCNHNTFFNNTIENNGIENTIDDCFGIYFYEECDNNNITQNSIIDNDYHGIYLTIGSGNNTIAENIIGNTITSNQETGIFIENCDDNIIISNFIFNNSWRGVDIDANSDRNSIFLNYFLSNGIEHARDLGTNNNWNSSTIGNYWDNYIGVDDNQDGIGDSPHSFGNIIDYLPIWDDDTPNITIIEPSMNQAFGSNAPGFIVKITDVYLDRMWYSLYILESTVETPFTANSTIDQTLWNSLSEGIHTISFHASDFFDHIATKNVTIIKDTINPLISIIFPLDGQTYDSKAPSFLVDISDTNLDKMWYTINIDPTKHFFTNNGTIQDWSNIPNGPVVITFFANDSAGNTHSEYVIITKHVPSRGIADPTTIIISVAFSIALAGVGIVAIYLLRVNRSLRKRLEPTEK